MPNIAADRLSIGFNHGELLDLQKNYIAPLSPDKGFLKKFFFLSLQGKAFENYFQVVRK
jgi:hypothetical protein